MVAYILLPTLSIFTSGYLRGCRSGINLVPDRADSSLMEEIRNSFSFRKNEIAAGRIEFGDGHPVSELTYGADGDGMVPFVTGKDGLKKGNGFSVHECFKR